MNEALLFTIKPRLRLAHRLANLVTGKCVQKKIQRPVCNSKCNLPPSEASRINVSYGAITQELESME